MNAVPETRVAIIDYQAGNLKSCSKAFEHIATTMSGNTQVKVIRQADELDDATHIVLPGQGAFGDCMSGLKSASGMTEKLQQLVLDQGRPFFGICVGMQLLADKGLEFGETKGLGWISGEIVAHQPEDASLKIPHMGWNNLELTAAAASHPVLKDVAAGEHAYFVHSYRFDHENGRDLLSYADYGGPVTAIVGRDNLIGTQFHPEKSQALGLKLIQNFLMWRP